MKYDLKGISVLFEDETGEEIEEKFSNATSAVEFIADNMTDFEIDEDDFSIVADFKERGHIHSASSEPLDEDDAELSFSQLKDIADEEPMSYSAPKKTEERKFKTWEEWMDNKNKEEQSIEEPKQKRSKKRP